MATKKISVEILLQDILARMRTIEINNAESAKAIAKTLSDSDKTLSDRLCKIESEIENVKKAAKMFSLFVKVITGLVAFIVTVWNLFGKYLVKK